MTAPIVKPNSTQDQDLNVPLSSLTESLGFTTHQNIKSRFETFKAKLLKNTQINEKNYLFKSYSYMSPQFVLVDSYMLSVSVAMAFAVYVDPSRGMAVITALSTAQPEPAPIPYFHAKTCNKRMLAERFNRSISSITTTFERNAKWLIEIGGMEEHIEERDGDLWFTEAYASCIAFGGGKVAAQTKAKMMVASYDNQKIPSNALQKLLK